MTTTLTAIDLIDDPLHHVRKVATRLNLPMPTMEGILGEDGEPRYAEQQWPEAYWVSHWFFPNEEPDPQWGREKYDDPTDALRSVLTVPGGTGHFIIEELVAEFLTTRLVHDPLYRAEVDAFRATGKPCTGPEWHVLGDEHSWFRILADKDDWSLWFAELVAHIAEAAGLVSIGYSIYSSRLSERAKAWALLIRIHDLAQNGQAYADEYDALVAMGADDTGEGQ